jgi:cytochrome P450
MSCVGESTRGRSKSCTNDTVCLHAIRLSVHHDAVLTESIGPVVRINPHELHVSDPAFYDSVYVGPSRRTEKWDYSARMFGTELAAVGTTGHELHRLRRSALNAFFSKRSIGKLEPTIQHLVEQACRQLKHGSSNGRVLNLRNLFAAFSADVIGEVAFGSGYGLLDKEDFEPGWQRLMMVDIAIPGFALPGLPCRTYPVQLI